MAKARILEQNSGAFGKEVYPIIKVQDSTSVVELSVDQSGSLVILRANGGNRLVNLPDAADNAGVYYEFMVNENLDGTVSVQSLDGTDFFLGFVSDAEVDAQAEVAFNGTSHDQMVFASGAGKGDIHVKCICDGDNWLVIGQANDISDISAGTSSSNT
tara:strand:- start:3119 stop:3592 length:474 start_codon:yes stop_codon:yes gene_type:complete